MSTNNTKILNIESVIDRIKAYSNLSTYKQVAELIGVAYNNFIQKKQTGPLIKDIFVWGYKNNLNLNWLFYGIGSAETVSDVENALIRDGTIPDELYSEIMNFAERDEAGIAKL